jgi:hypothetical protein
MQEAERMRAAFQIAITALGQARNMMIIWPRGGAQKRLLEVSAMIRKALGDVAELLEPGGVTRHGSNKDSPVDAGGVASEPHDGP